MMTRLDIDNLCDPKKNLEMKPVTLWVVRASGKVIGVYQTHKMALLKISERGDEPELQRYTVIGSDDGKMTLEDVCRFINNFCLGR